MENNTAENVERTDVHAESFRALAKATALLRARYADFESFHDEMIRLMRFFKPGEEVALDVFIEGLYLIAKFASHSQAPARCPEAVWRLANQKAEPANRPSGLQ
jgi:hypothetical protein